MAKMTMHQELEMLRQQVSELKQQQTDTQLSSGKQKIQQAKQAIEQEAEKIEVEVKDMIGDLVEQLKTDYDNVSPAGAVLIFALGALFGRVISSK